MGGGKKKDSKPNMKWNLIIRPEAEQDISEVYDWYEERRKGLGDEFLLP